MSLQPPPTETTEPVIVVPAALHALSAVPEKLRPMLLSLRPVTVPLSAANAGSSTIGISANSITATISSVMKRFVIRRTIIIFSLFF